MLRISCLLQATGKRNMSRRYRLPRSLLATGLLAIALSLTASNFRGTDRAAGGHAAQLAAIQPAGVQSQRVTQPHAAGSLPAHPGVSTSYSRQRYIVQSASAEAA